MREVIDELSLKIDVNAKRGIAKTITAIADAITTLNKSVRNVGALERYVKTLNKLMKPAIRVPKNTAVGKTIQKEYEEVPETPKSDSKLNEIQTKAQETTTQETTSATNDIKNSVDELNMTYAEWVEKAELVSKSLKINKDGAKEVVEQFKYLNKEGQIFTATAVDKEITKTSQSFKKVNSEGTKASSTFKKLVKSIGRIAFYRAIRMAINQVAKAFEEGFKNFVQFDDEANKSMSNITNSVNQLKNSLGVSLGSVLQALEPLIVSLAEGATKFVDSINLALAKMQGQSTYKKAIKQNEDYAKSLEKTNNALLSFDKFEALSDKKQESPFEEVAVDSENNAVADVFTEVFETIKILFGAVKKLVEALLPIVEKVGMPLLDIVVKIAELLVPIIDIVALILNYVSPIFDIIGHSFEFMADSLDIVIGAFKIIASLFKLLSGDVDGFLQDISNGFAKMINSVVNMFIDMINFMIDGLNMLLKPIDVIAGWFGGNVEIPTISWKMNWQPYADGGMVPKGTKFIAGESGAEIVHQSSAGTGVANIEQIRQAQYLATMDAIQDSGILNALSNIGGDVLIDGRKCGQVITKHVVDEGTRVGYFKKA